ncbi:DUF3857 domain-containing protein [Mucilaginibacter sp. SMC90]|uniref:DUF3857 domain-containing protein n=1 Tax=Mucilaginibacter sp. SMC90 TaxID=2929803 RepID=UPI001FB2E805|nr:DUF3857 domain-containing protein [Mucilaginibacter sp. SMC90]UOE49021.1 DUF3857 domain-containing protein [Mucilaginibacter sp. SMC90]
MNKLLTLIAIGAFATAAKAQAPAIPTAQAFGKIDKADLEMKACDFEKDANAEVLFDKGEVYFDTQYNIVFEKHRRIKIFNDNGKDEANIRLTYFSVNHAEFISGLQAETINLENGVATPIKVDKKQIFTQIVDKNRSAIVFSFPNVKPGSIIEYKYKHTINNIADFPDWYFQGDLPTRYSEINTNIPDILTYKNLVNLHYPLVVDKVSGTNTHTQAMANIPSVKEEPFMDAISDNSERILYQLLSIRGTFMHSFSDTWAKVGENVVGWDDFGGQFNRKLAGEETIIAKAKTLKTDDEKIAYIFNEVKNAMKWDESYDRTTNDGTVKAWEKKTGNSTEVNLILYHLLQKSGIRAYPMMVSTRKHGRINPAYPNSYQFNSTVAYIPVDSTKHYVLDATSKYNVYNQIPFNYLNSFGFLINKTDAAYDMIFLENTDPVRQVVLINAEIKPDGKMAGNADISSFAYNRINAVKDYKTDGEKKYIESLRDNNNNLKISSLKIEDIDIDTLPLRQNINFNLDLTGSDDNYIYFNSNLFTDLNKNPFLSENRTTDINFGYRDNYAITGIFKLPAGYKIDALPKSVSMATPDNSIVFKRLVAEQDGQIMVRLNIDHKKSIYFKEEYSDFHEFCKKMYEMLNEQIVLKKS